MGDNVNFMGGGGPFARASPACNHGCLAFMCQLCRCCCPASQMLLRQLALLQRLGSLVLSLPLSSSCILGREGLKDSELALEDTWAAMGLGFGPAQCNDQAR